MSLAVAETGQHYGDRHGVRLLSRLAEEGRFVFTTEEAREVASKLGIPEGYLRQLLTRLDRSGWITRIRRGLYAGTGKLPGHTDVHPFVIATRLVTPSAVSHWSAMHHHGLTEQIPQAVTAMTPSKVVTPSMRRGAQTSSRPRSGQKHAWEVRCSRYEYVTVKPENFFGIEEVWVDELFSVPIADRERTMLEGFVSPRTFGGMGEVLGILEEHISELDLEKLAAYALRFDKGSVAKRLGWSLEHLGVEDGTLSALLDLPVSGYRLLDPTRPQCGKYDSRWMVQDNISTPSTEQSSTPQSSREAAR